MTTANTGPFPRIFFQFLVELKFNNERAWFQQNKARYEAQVKGPFQDFVKRLLPGVTRINPSYTHTKVFRAYRDTRFAKDKSPYKTHVAAQFRHRVTLGDVHAPGFYLHLEPGESFAAAGIWMPVPEALASIRKRIARRDPAWIRLRHSKLPLSNENTLKRPPKGYSPEHPLLEDLKRRNFITWVDFTDQEAAQMDFSKRVLAAFRKANPLICFLNRAMGL
ncbi:MAG: DUF2461 domain-containing protein [bacterium]